MPAAMHRLALARRAPSCIGLRPQPTPKSLRRGPAVATAVPAARWTHGTAARPFYASNSSDGAPEGIFNSPQRPVLAPLDTFSRRHIGPSAEAIDGMLAALDPPARSLDDFIKEVMPEDILSSHELSIDVPEQYQKLGEGMAEADLLARLRQIAAGNKVMRSYIGTGYAGTKVPEVIKRNVLENPAWYTSYTPYQAEISQGRMESLLNFQTMVADLTGLAMANASLLDEPTAAAEAMTLCINALPAARQKKPGKTFAVSHLCHPQTLEVLKSRADGFGIRIKVVDVMADGHSQVLEVGDSLIGVLVQYPDTEGGVEDFAGLANAVHAQGGSVCAATDLLALTLLKPPGEWGADIAFGNAQRFGVPFGFGGPHAAFFACNDKQKRKIPGRVIGVSKDRLGGRAMRLALQTREQHIRREKATSNICTAQALLANMSALYAVYHGPEGLRAIATRAVAGAQVVQEAAKRYGFETAKTGVGKDGRTLFDTVAVDMGGVAASEVAQWAAANQGINVRVLDQRRIAVTVDETVDTPDLQDIAAIFQYFSKSNKSETVEQIVADLGLKTGTAPLASPLARTSSYLTHPVFNSHHSETDILRYMHHLQSKDLSLAHSMIPLGSCTMKLNATTEMVPISWPEFASMHPYAPDDQAQGYHELIRELETDLAEITGFDAVTVQPNSGAQGEFTGLRVIRAYMEAQKQGGGKKRDICLIPVSAHGTNPASAAMAGMRVVTIKCEPGTGNLDMADLKAKCAQHADELAAIMITYPSTFGVFEPNVRETCRLVHEHGGQVYMDGANMNAQIGLCSPGEIGADVCHLNLHKTFCIPHGGGGPGVGPVGVKAHLAPYLPGHPLAEIAGKPGTTSVPAVSGAPWGSAGILPISWAYIKMMGGRGLTQATKLCLLNANYVLARLKPRFEILYTNAAGRCAHEFILDLRPFKQSAGVEAIDVAKRLQDYGFHAPTMSWPVAGTLMIEPTESESREELDRFCDALLAIREEIAAIERGDMPRDGNALKNAPHPVQDLLADGWDRPYSRQQAAYPLPWLREKKFWPVTARVDDAYGDTNLFCTCGPVDAINEPEETK